MRRFRRCIFHQHILELLGRFELPTSSLPILPQLFFLILSCFVLKTETLAPQGFQSFLFCVLVSPILRLRMGFLMPVWVLYGFYAVSNPRQFSNASNAFILTQPVALECVKIALGIFFYLILGITSLIHRLQYSAFCQRFQQGHRSIAQVFCCAALICAILRHILLLLRWYCLFYLRLLLTNHKFSAILILVIRSQKLVGPVIGGVPAGTPLFLRW